MSRVYDGRDGVNVRMGELDLSALEIIQEHDSRAEVLHLRGAIDAHTSSEVETRLEELLQGGAQGVVLDFSDVVYVSSAGFGVLLNALHAFRLTGAELKIAEISERVLRLFATLGFHRIFDMRPSVAEAIASFEELGAGGDGAGGRS